MLFTFYYDKQNKIQGVALDYNGKRHCTHDIRKGIRSDVVLMLSSRTESDINKKEDWEYLCKYDWQLESRELEIKPLAIKDETYTEIFLDGNLFADIKP